MIIPSQHASRVARAAAGGGGGGGVTPNAVNWANVVGNWPCRSAMLQITGITSTITLRLTYTGDGYDRQYSVKSTAAYGTGTAIASNGTFTISNNQYLGFQNLSANPDVYETTSFTLTNVSDADAVIDTFSLSAFYAE